MEYKHFCVIDALKFYKTLVLVIIRNTPGEDGSVTSEAEVQYYAMLPGESLIETKPPSMRQHAGALGFVKPKWDEDSNRWAEGATEDEIADWEAEHPAPEEPEPPAGGTLEQRVAALEAAQANAWSEQAAAIREGVNSVE
ncbi:hypothetical protein [Candidatus Agathobaculum pullicola]|uniref:hypothetical protein n=1 Tax=Candidatus Agathobaculum pullicola TaxID=2838426 RepID=UPI003F903048